MRRNIKARAGDGGMVSNREEREGGKGGGRRVGFVTFVSLFFDEGGCLALGYEGLYWVMRDSILSIQMCGQTSSNTHFAQIQPWQQYKASFFLGVVSR
jgi:hypothetical protein